MKLLNEKGGHRKQNSNDCTVHMTKRSPVGIKGGINKNTYELFMMNSWEVVPYW
jgi:hypothetical protein